jgi:hypothetical protein
MLELFDAVFTSFSHLLLGCLAPKIQYVSRMHLNGTTTIDDMMLLLQEMHIPSSAPSR